MSWSCIWFKQRVPGLFFLQNNICTPAFDLTVYLLNGIQFCNTYLSKLKIIELTFRFNRIDF